MNVYLMTDMEAVAGVIDSLNWCYPGSRYYDLGRELLTREVNAAVEGFLEAGASRITVCDGHGWGGIHPKLLHPHAELLAGSFQHTKHPFGLSPEYDVIGWVGQHAMAGTPFGHLPHTGSFNVLESSLNGQPMGEMGRIACVAAEQGVRSIFLSGDLAGCNEAIALVPDIETVVVKEGLCTLSDRDLTADDVEATFTAARHLSPETARERIREGAARSLSRAKDNPDMGRLTLPSPPYLLVSVNRRGANGEPEKTYVRSHPDSIIGVLNAPVVER